jgi:hypothetical protein
MTIKYDRVCLMLPTYGRSQTLLPKFVDSAIKTASSQKTVCFAFCANKRDTATLEYLRTKDFQGHDHEVVVEDLPRPDLSVYFNMLYDQTKTRSEPGTLVSMVGDDMVFETHGWDATLLGQANHYEGVGVFYFNDAYIARERCAVNMFVTRKMVEATEQPFMAPFAADMIDVVWTEVGRATKTLHFYPDIVLRHNHNTKLAVQSWDDTYRRLKGVQDEVRAARGKKQARNAGLQIAQTLIAKGYVGDSIC